MTSARCTKCDALKPLWSTHRLCPKCRREHKPNIIASQSDKIINSRGETVQVFETKILGFTFQSRGAFAHTRHRQYKSDGALLWFSRKIYLRKGMMYAEPEDLAQIINAESIHQAFYTLGFGKENVQLDKMKLHTWISRQQRLEEYDGLAIKQFGLRREG